MSNTNMVGKCTPPALEEGMAICWTEIQFPRVLVWEINMTGLQSSSVVAWGWGWEWGLNSKTRTSWHGWCWWPHDCGPMTVWIEPKSSNYFKWLNFMVCNLNLNKTVLKCYRKTIHKNSFVMGYRLWHERQNNRTSRGKHGRNPSWLGGRQMS